MGGGLCLCLCLCVRASVSGLAVVLIPFAVLELAACRSSASKGAMSALGVRASWSVSVFCLFVCFVSVLCLRLQTLCLLYMSMCKLRGVRASLSLTMPLHTNQNMF